MQTNSAAVDRIWRVAAMPVLLSLASLGPRTIWGLIGVIPLAAAAVRACPLDRLFGTRTCQTV